jgi:FLVCR family MFS transporter 7
MTLSSEDPRPAAGDETQKGPGAGGKGGQEKGPAKSTHEGIAGWAFMMRPLRRKAGKASSPSGSSETETSNTAATGNGQHEEDRDSAQSKGSSYGATHTETLREVTSEDGLLPGQQAQGHAVGSSNSNNDDAQHDGSAPGNGASAGEEPKFKVYKRRWFGVVQLVLLNTIVSWDVSTLPTNTFLASPEML